MTSRKKLFIGLTAIAVVGLVLLIVFKSPAELSDEEVIDRFRKIYYRHEPLKTVKYLGIRSVQFPSDNWVMQEMISEIKPDFIIETGTADGGTTLFYATILEKVNSAGKVITIDVKDHDPKVEQFETWQKHVEAIKGNSISREIVNQIADRVKGHKVLVTLDSLHTKGHVLKELKLYSPLVPVDGYIVVQDTHFGGRPVRRGRRGNGPWEAVEAFLKGNENFIIDHSWEKYLLTQNPSGYLKRIKK